MCDVAHVVSVFSDVVSVLFECCMFHQDIFECLINMERMLQWVFTLFSMDDYQHF
jgi:hypothetical protein